jgi:hypothetical protein
MRDNATALHLERVIRKSVRQQSVLRSLKTSITGDDCDDNMHKVKFEDWHIRYVSILERNCYTSIVRTLRV